MKIDKNLRSFINELIDAFPFRMFMVKRGYVYWLVDHYKYLDYKRECKCVKLGRTNGEAKDGYYYLTERLKG